MSDFHYFDTAIAKEYGICEAIVLQHIKYWVVKNRANGRNFHDGYFWTYNSSRAFSEIFPYMNAPKIARILNKLEEDGLILSGNYNEHKMDRTKWYTLTKKAFALYGEELETDKDKVWINPFEESITQNCGIHSQEIDNRSTKIDNPSTNFDNPKSKNVEPIPDNKPDSKQQIINTDKEREGENLPTLAEEKKVKKKTSSKKETPKKIAYGEFVNLTEEEYQKLLNDERLGDEYAVKQCIEILNDYKGASGKKYSSDYFAIRKWVINRYLEEKSKYRPENFRNRRSDSVSSSASRIIERMRQMGVER